jgi:SRSO17 transposase
VETGAATVDHRRVKTNDHAVATGHSVDPACWQEAFEGLMSRIAGRFTRVESRRRARKLVLGLLSDLENAQVAVYLVYAGRRGHAAGDRELHVPRSWTSDPDRCRAAGLGDDTECATKPELAARMVTRFLDAGHRAAWVAGDEVYGGTPRLRTALEERGTGYVLAVACSHEVTPGAGRFRADMSARKVPKRAGRSCPQGPEPRATASTTGTRRQAAQA